MGSRDGPRDAVIAAMRYELANVIETCVHGAKGDLPGVSA
jgi:hypothetical protein